MSAIYEIPLNPQAQTFSTTLGTTSYRLRLTYNPADTASWILDIGAADGTVLVAGIPLVSGSDLLAQYAYMGFGGQLILTTDRDAGEVPGYADLGTTSHLFFAAA